MNEVVEPEEEEEEEEEGGGGGEDDDEEEKEERTAIQNTRKSIHYFCALNHPNSKHKIMHKMPNFRAPGWSSLITKIYF
jgi:hypothetical protein